LSLRILIRDYEAVDLYLVFDSWLNSWRVNRHAGVIPNHKYYDLQREVIEGLIIRGAKINVAASFQSGASLGWVCYELKDEIPIVHYLYVKDPYLSYPVVRTLLESVPGTKPGFITHKLPLRELREWKHAPEIARRKVL
jgi:hypothetical protein